MSQGWAPITSVARIVNPGDGLLRWANQLGLEGKSLDERDGRSEGSFFHRQVDRILKGEDPDTVLFGVTQQPARNFLEAWLAWWRATQPTVLYAERNVESRRLMARGRVDLVCRCSDPDCVCQGEGAELLDYKTGGHQLYVDAHIQGDGYREVWPDCGLDPRHLCRVKFLSLDARGTFQLHPLSAQPGDFLAALELWRRVIRMRDELRC